MRLSWERYRGFLPLGKPENATTAQALEIKRKTATHRWIAVPRDVATFDYGRERPLLRWRDC